MSSQQYTELLLQTLGEALTLDEETRSSLKLDTNNECFVSLDDRFVVAIYFDEEINALHLNLPIAPLPEDESREEVMLELLMGNYAWNLTEGGTLGVDRITGLITLSYLVPLPLQEPAQFVSIINKLLSVTAYWKDEIQETSDEGATASSEDPAANYIRA